MKIEAVGNVFFDISDRDFRIEGAAAQLSRLITLATGVGAGKSLEYFARSASATLEVRNVAGTCGHLETTTCAVPESGVLARSTCGYVYPPSSDRLIRTLSAPQPATETVQPVRSMIAVASATVV